MTGSRVISRSRATTKAGRVCVRAENAYSSVARWIVRKLIAPRLRRWVLSSGVSEGGLNFVKNGTAGYYAPCIFLPRKPVTGIINRLLRKLTPFYSRIRVPPAGVQAYFAKRASRASVHIAANHDVRSSNSESVFNGIVIANVADADSFRRLATAPAQFSSLPYVPDRVYIKKRKKSLPARRMHVS